VLYNFAHSLPKHLQEQPNENPSISIILCADKENVAVEIALNDFNKPIGVADYRLQIPEKQLKEIIAQELKEIAGCVEVEKK
jgi:hypothetical protein